MDRSTSAETLRVGGREYRIAPLAAAAKAGQKDRKSVV